VVGLFPVLPAGVSAVVTVAGTAPNFTYTITFFGLTSNPGTMTIANNTAVRRDAAGRQRRRRLTSLPRVQTISVNGTPTAGTFTLSGGPLTGPTVGIGW